MPGGLLGAVEGIANPEATVKRSEMRLADTLARQREQDIAWKRSQTDVLEGLVRDGKMDWSEALDRISEVWGDHKPNKDHIKELTENAQGIHGLFDKVKHVLFPPPPANPLGTGNYKVPPGQPYTFSGPTPPGQGSSTGTGALPLPPPPAALSTAPPSAPAIIPPTINTLMSNAPLVYRNRTTGETRYSVDGGKTWLQGPPK